MNSNSNTRKRKLSENLPKKGQRNKHQKKELLPDQLKWKEVRRPKETGLDDFEGMLMLEEVEGVEIVYEESSKGRIAKFVVNDQGEQNDTECGGNAKIVEEADGAEWGGISIEEPKVSVVQEKEAVSASSPRPQSKIASSKLDVDAIDTEWITLELDTWLLKGIIEQGFSKPTPIQSQSIPFALHGRDVIGIAQTGSGKTIAYGLPILHHLLQEKNNQKSPAKRMIKALILAPTRELAMQISTHLNACLNPLVKSEKSAEGGSKSPRVSVAAIVGGMSPQKQKRILDRGVDVLVATPGRLWDIMGEDDKLSSQIKQIRFLVLDEADRMIEQGHFQELDNILRLTLRTPKFDQSELPEGMEPPPTDIEDEPREDLQTFIFSATLSKDLQTNLKKPRWKRSKTSSTTLDELLSRLDFRDENPQIIDISPEGGVVSTLKECHVECLNEDKDAYLYYFLLRYPGRSLVFVSSIDGIRRLVPLLELLKLKAFPLHSQLEQRQRLKYLDRFKSTSNGVLIATDIAARGLDIPAVDHVIHYQVPRTADTYVHRNGRTARANREGLALVLTIPEDRKMIRSLFISLGRNESDIGEINVDHDILNKLKVRVQLARDIDKAHHRVTKRNHERNWMKETADALDVILDSDEEDSTTKARERKGHDIHVAQMKMQLNDLLSRPVVARGISTRYITSGSLSIADDLLNGTVHESMLGVDKSGAGAAVNTKQVRKPKKRRKLGKA